MRVSPTHGALVVLYLSSSTLAHSHGHQHHARQGPAYPTGPGYSIPPVATVTQDFEHIPPEPTVALPPLNTGAGLYPGAPPLPDVAIVPTEWPELDKVPPTNTPQVQAWMKEIEGLNIPNYSITSGDCDTSPTIVPEAGADKRCWWTCGGCTRSTDITTCNKKGHWGLTFDDGPTETTPKLLTYLNSKNLKASFYMVGSRVISHPQMAQYQHLSGHELSVHTWSHASLTTLTNEQIVAELGWTRKAIRDVTGVTPLSMRPPRGDIDDRVRAISLAMGMTPILWTGVDPNAFDTNDWRVSAGQMTAQESVSNFTRILDTANSLTTGFIVLEHDNHAQPVNLAIGTTIPLGQSRGFILEPVHQCLDRPLSDSYAETVKNPAIPTPRTNGTVTPTGSAKPGSAAGLEVPALFSVFAAIGAMLLG